MESDWEEVLMVPHPGQDANHLTSRVTTLAFDTSQELLWTGNHVGRVMSFIAPDLRKYTSFRAHPTGEVKQILFTDKGVLSVSPHSVHLASRRGLTQWHMTDEKFIDLRCMSFTSRGTQEILVAGFQDTMFRVDVEKGTIIQALPAEDNYSIMKKGSQYICAANGSGAIHILDPGTFKIVKVWQAHSSFVNDMDVKSDFVVTCGASPRQQQGFMLDGLANVYNLKTLLPLPPIPFQAGAAFVRMHPRMSTTSIVASSTGQLQVVDIMNPNAVNLIKQAHVYDSTCLTSFELAPSGDALAFANSLGYMHLWGSPSKIHFTEFSNPLVFADQVIPPPGHMDWSQDTALNTIGIPYYRDVLLSAWPSHMIFEVGAPPPKLDPILLANLKRSDNVSYAPNPKKLHRNQIERTRVVDKGSAIVAPKFLSEKAREAASSPNGERRISDVLDTLADIILEGSTKKEVPIIYRNVEIKYSKFGVDDFDFEYYNKTRFSGLETHIANSYANPLLQLYRFIPIIRNLALRHTASPCPFEDCLLCETGFLIDMLEKAAGQNCQATNFLKKFSGQSSAASLNLLEEHAPTTPLTSMIQAVNRFLLARFSDNFRQCPPQSRALEQALATQVTANIRCAHCNHEQIKSEDLYLHDLIYPPKNMIRGPARATPSRTFCEILKASVERQDQSRGWCSRCKRYQMLSTRKQVQNVPSVLMINAAIHTMDAKQLWCTPNWLPHEIGVVVGNGQFFCFEGQDLNFLIKKNTHNVQIYELIGVVADINSGEAQKPHLVSMINVAPSLPDEQVNNQWHLFNDFLVRQTSKEEALRFDPDWKLPSVLAYQLKSESHVIDDSWKMNLDTSILYRSETLSHHTEPSNIPLRLLSPEEPPCPGMPVGIDAEFVALQREEIAIKADGTRETIRPSRLGLARVSVLRGSGMDADLPFIDDYIAISEPVVDYLTQHSGIRPGDLDRMASKHTLVSLKMAYKKLWLLLNLGCIFVGHGLIKDFRTINIHVPKAQVIDTVELFWVKTRVRKLSLRFLAWLLLKEDIQMDMHDSVEDAWTALRLWRKYEEFKDAGVLEETLEWIYKKGAEVRFKVPGAAAPVATAVTVRSDRRGYGRNTPPPGFRSESSGGGDGEAGRTESTPIKKLTFGTGPPAFGSPARR
ncbi:PAB-dependent poly(A)-specific ribonuclease subunit PAN2 [Trichodelitschia bisporula]|uniref:PAN2-PAN3 deadenylation complex catalytic subunit PAN2 n=1 Tax=Trichodelitschia bisporula TaxID=703511 RepID=A0A6G1HMA0_9PEZI|nr:PAB-dependent poly(A)-specific ribonuclease subunit PAN2 [Trichodelitschia bisporula]